MHALRGEQTVAAPQPRGSSVESPLSGEMEGTERGPPHHRTTHVGGEPKQTHRNSVSLL